MEPSISTKSKQQIIDEYRECKVKGPFGPIFGSVLVVVIVLLPVFMHEYESLKGVSLLIGVVYILLYFIAVYKNSQKKMDLIFEFLSVKED